MRRPRTPVELVALPVIGYLVLLALVAALYVKPPLLGWIGFAVVGAVGAALAVAGAVLFPRMRVTAGAPRAEAGRDRILVLADTRCPGAALCSSIAEHVHGRPADVRVVAPVLASPLHYLMDDEGHEAGEAHERLEQTLNALRRAGIPVTGSLGVDDPVQAIGDALAAFPATELVIVTQHESHWLERDLAERARELVPLVEEVLVEPELAPAVEASAGAKPVR